MIWNDAEIHTYATDAKLVVPFDPANVNPASIDLRLGNQLREPHPIWGCTEWQIKQWIGNGKIYDLPKWSDPVEFESYWLMPRRFVLCHSLEFVQIPTHAAAILVLKSSMGRLGLNHSHSGWGDPGFGLAGEKNSEGGASWTFELYNISPWPIELKAGQRIIQMVMMDMAGAPEQDYRQTGNYVYQTGPTPAKEGA